MTDKWLEELAVQEPAGMRSGCSDYACDCHAKVPELVAEVRRLKAENHSLLCMVETLREERGG